MVLGDYMKSYLLDEDEKWVIREAKRSCFVPVLQRFRSVQILKNMRLVEGFC